MESLKIEGIADLSADDAHQVREFVRGQHRLVDVLRDAARLDPPRAPDATIAMDEFSHDVVLRFADHLHLVYGST